MGLFSSVGGFLNDITGITSSSNNAFSQSKYLSNASIASQKEFAQNAHQWEAQDLEKAGFNKALTATGSSAGAIAGEGQIGNSGNVGTSASITPLNIIDAVNTTRATTSNINLQKAQGNAQEMAGLASLANAMKSYAELPYIGQRQKAEINLFVKKANEAIANTKFANERARGITDSETSEWSNSTGGGVNVFGTGGNANRSNSRKTSKTTVR